MSQSYGRQDETYMANADFSLGVIQDLPVQGKAGAPSAIRRTGTSKVVAGAPFAAGVPLTSDGVGRAVQATAGQFINGYALEAATAIGDIVESTVELAGTV
jgi:hypothetical protein